MAKTDQERQTLVILIKQAKPFADLLDVYAARVAPHGVVISDDKALGPVLKDGSLVVPGSLYTPAQLNWVVAIATASTAGMTLPPWPFRTSFGVDVPLAVSLPIYKNSIRQMEEALGLTPPLKYAIAAVGGAALIAGAFWRLGKKS